MQIDGLRDLIQLAIKTLREPKRCLRIVLDIVITMPELMQATALVVLLSMILPIISLMLQPIEVQQAMSAFSSNPIPIFILQVFIILGSAGLITTFGKMFQGYGTFKETLTAMVWLQFVLLGVQILQLLVSIIAPGFNAAFFLGSVLMMIYLTISFIMEIHGFNNLAAVTISFFGCFFALIIALSILLALFGITPEVIKNV